MMWFIGAVLGRHDDAPAPRRLSHADTSWEDIAVGYTMHEVSDSDGASSSHVEVSDGDAFLTRCPIGSYGADGSCQKPKDSVSDCQSFQYNGATPDVCFLICDACSACGYVAINTTDKMCRFATDIATFTAASNDLYVRRPRSHAHATPRPPPSTKTPTLSFALPTDVRQGWGAPAARCVPSASRRIHPTAARSGRGRAWGPTAPCCHVAPTAGCHLPSTSQRIRASGFPFA